MTPKEKAVELVDKFKDYVHGYIGSSMLTNHEYPEQILAQAKKVALITVAEILDELTELPYGLEYLWRIDYWTAVEEEIKSL